MFLKLGGSRFLQLKSEFWPNTWMHKCWVHENIFWLNNCMAHSFVTFISNLVGGSISWRYSFYVAPALRQTQRETKHVNSSSDPASAHIFKWKHKAMVFQTLNFTFCSSFHALVSCCSHFFSRSQRVKFPFWASGVPANPTYSSSQQILSDFVGWKVTSNDCLKDLGWMQQEGGTKAHKPSNHVTIHPNIIWFEHESSSYLFFFASTAFRKSFAFWYSTGAPASVKYKSETSKSKFNRKYCTRKYMKRVKTNCGNTMSVPNYWFQVQGVNIHKICARWWLIKWKLEQYGCRSSLTCMSSVLVQSMASYIAT